MLYALIAAFIAFIIIGVVLVLVGVPFAWLIAFALALAVFLYYMPRRGGRTRV